jgi:hypothetical protein
MPSACDMLVMLKKQRIYCRKDLSRSLKNWTVFVARDLLKVGFDEYS